MTRIAIVGAGPCGLSQMQAFRSAQANGAEIPEIVCLRNKITGAVYGTIAGGQVQMNMVRHAMAACINIFGRMDQRSA